MTMIASVLSNKDCIDAVLNSAGHTHSLVLLTPNELEKLRNLHQLLQPLEQATKRLGGETYVSISIALPELYYVKKKMAVTEDDPGYVTRFKRAFLEDINHRITVLTSNMHVKAATVLDPRFKGLKFLERDERQVVWNFLRNILLEDEEPSAVASSAKKSRYSFSDEEEPDELVTLTVSVEHILNSYRKAATPDDDVNPLNWWKEYGTSPKLSALARKYLCSTATTVPCERLFSQAGNIVSVRRASLHSDNVNKLCCLQSWL